MAERATWSTVGRRRVQERLKRGWSNKRNGVGRWEFDASAHSGGKVGGDIESGGLRRCVEGRFRVTRLHVWYVVLADDMVWWK